MTMDKERTQARERKKHYEECKGSIVIILRSRCSTGQKQLILMYIDTFDFKNFKNFE